MDKNQKGIVQLFILLGTFTVLIIGAIGYSLYKNSKTKDQAREASTNTSLESFTPTLTPTPKGTPLSDLKTYTNNKFKYSIQYPGNLTIDHLEQVEGEEEIVQIKDKQNEKGAEIIIDVSQDRISEELYLTYKSEVESRLQSNKPLEEEFRGVSGGYKKISIEGHEAYQLNIVSEIGTTSNTLFKKNAQIFKITIFTKEISLVDQILSTFKFLD